MNVKMFGEICDAFGPSGFEEDVIRTVAKYCKGLELENDAMNNLYARMPGEQERSDRSIRHFHRRSGSPGSFIFLR